MKYDFFTLSDFALKLRRNLLFVASLCIVHFSVTSLSALKIFNVSIPEKILTIGLPLFLLWFAFNYFYYLYAEYTQWRTMHIVDVDVPEGMSDKSWKHYTLIPEIQSLTNKSISIKAEFSSEKGYATPSIFTPEEVTEDTRELMGHIRNQIMSATKTDVKRIITFQTAIKRYNLANQLRFYILDSAVPFFTIFVSLCMAYNKV